MSPRGSERRPCQEPRGCHASPRPFSPRRSRWPEPWPEPDVERAAGGVPELELGAVPAVAGGDGAAEGLLARWVRGGTGTLPAATVPEPPQNPCPTGGDVTFDISNDAPTMAGAKATFSIALRFPGTQTALPDGRVVWSQNCTVNGQSLPDAPRPVPDGGRGRPRATLSVWSPQAAASRRVTPSSRSSWPRARTASSPMGSPFPAVPGASVKNSSTCGGRGVRPPLPGTVSPLPGTAASPRPALEPCRPHRALLAGGGWRHVAADGGDGRGGPGLLHHGGGRLPLPRQPEVHPHRPRQHPVQHHR